MKRFLGGTALFIAGMAMGFGLAVLILSRQPSQPENSSVDSSDQTKAPATTITIAALIDGSDRFLFTHESVLLDHGRWSPPRNVLFNGEPWTDLTHSPAGWMELARKLDLVDATIISRKGRDIVVLEHTPDGFALYFADTPMGAGPYEVTISIPHR